MSTGRGVPGWLAAVGAVLVVTGLIAWQLQAPAADPSDPVVTATPGAPDAPAPDPVPASQPAAGTAQPGAPRRVVIPALAVDAPVVPVQVSRDTLVPPADPHQLGWWADGARPGAERGSALVAGHTVHGGSGALDHLEQLTAGEQVVVVTLGGRIVYEVVRVRVYSKGRIARHAERLFSQEVTGRLVLVTCEDWDGSRYLSNVVVVARPVATRGPAFPRRLSPNASRGAPRELGFFSSMLERP